eukprot:35198-Pelagomonas_calceolata.AAC.1
MPATIPNTSCRQDIQNGSQKTKKKKLLHINTQLPNPTISFRPYAPKSRHINAWKIFTAKERDRSDDLPLQQNPYYTHFAPMTKEKWALTTFKNAGFTPASIEPAARAEIKCACCEICKYPGGKEFLNSEPLILIRISVMSAIKPITGRA